MYEKAIHAFLSAKRAICFVGFLPGCVKRADKKSMLSWVPAVVGGYVHTFLSHLGWEIRRAWRLSDSEPVIVELRKQIEIHNRTYPQGKGNEFLPWPKELNL